jgi:hypothetical protein
MTGTELEPGGGLGPALLFMIELSKDGIADVEEVDADC